MTKPSKAGSIFLVVFSLPFLGMGLAFMFQQFIDRADHPPLETIASMLFGSVFATIGGFLMYAAVAGYAVLKKQAALEEANPQSPWLWRKDWAAQRAESRNKNSQITYWVIFAFAAMLVFPFVVTNVPQMARSGDPRVFLLLGFSSIAVILFVVAMRATIRHRRFGNTFFEFDSLPFSPGGHIRGKIHLKLETQIDHGIDLRLSCVRKLVTGSGDHSSTSQIVLWQADQNVPSGAVEPGPIGRAIPVDFSIPADSAATNLQNSNDQILWQLHAQADVPGVNYKDDFELPVFPTADTSAAVRDANSETIPGDKFGFATARQDDSDSATLALPANAKVVVSAKDGGTEFYFPALRSPARALVLLAVAGMWTGVCYLLYLKHAPWLFVGVFGLSDVFIVAGFFHVAFGIARIAVSSGEIRFRSGILGTGAMRRVASSDIASVLPVASLQQGGNSANSRYLIRLRTNDGKKFTLVDEIASREEARWVASQIQSLAGLKADAHVDIDLPLGVPAQPVLQSGGAYQNKARPRASTAASIAIFILIVIAMLAWVSWRSFAISPRPGNSRSGNSRSTAPRSNPATRR